MTLTTHAVVGAAVASFFPEHAVVAFCLAFSSHFVLDAIPHWDYPIRSDAINPSIGAKPKWNKALVLDFFCIGGDALLGIFLALLLFSGARPVSLLLIGAIGAILPDALQAVYGHFRHEPLISLQQFHQWIHTSHRFKQYPILGVLTQVIFLVIVSAIAVFLIR